MWEVREIGRYTYTRDGFEQDVILYENPGSPADYGLNPDTTLLEMYSEFFKPPAPTIRSSADNDQSLNFGQMQMGRGQAYFLNDTLGAADVDKTWANIDGRIFLVESVPYPAVRSMLEKMALAQRQASNRSMQDRKGLVAGLRPRERAMRVASIKPGKSKSNSGFLIDFVTKNSNLTNFTWQGDTTYFISGNVGLYGTNTIFEGGAVLKYTNNVSLTVNTPLTWLGSPYRPVVLTARDDASVGDLITPTNAFSGYYATVALVLDGNAANTNFVLQNLRVANAQTAISLSGGAGHTISHAQLVTCQNGIAATNTEFSLRNALFDHVLTNFTGSASTGRVEHLTADTATWLNKDIGANLFLTNCLLVSVTNGGSFSSNSVYSTTASGVFQSVGQGFHYLADNTYRNLGTTSINSTLAGQLKKLTTYPPLILTSDLTVNTTLTPQAQRDTDTPDLGWHYDPLDYCWSGLNLTNATLTLTNGVAIGFYGSYGLHLRTSANFVSEGTPINLNRMTRYHTVQEQTVNWDGTTPVCYLQLPGTYSPRPAVTIRFSDVTSMAANYDSGSRQLVPNGGSNPFSSFTLAHSSLRGMSYSYYPQDSSSVTWGWTNNLFERCYLFLPHSYSSLDTPLTVNLRNNLFGGGSLTLEYVQSTNSNPNWTVKDNAFDNQTLSYTDVFGYVLKSNNGFINTSNPMGGNSNVVVSSFTYATGALGPWYQSSTNLIDKGSRTADQAGLYHYTTQTSQAKETTSTLDIGYHYVATDSNGVPLDNDSDGVPDYLEDRNGNSSVDSGETDWRSETGGAGDLGLKVWITEPKSNSNLP